MNPTMHGLLANTIKDLHESMHHYIFDCPTWSYEWWFMGRSLGRFAKSADQVLCTQKGIKELLHFVGHTGHLMHTFGKVSPVL